MAANGKMPVKYWLHNNMVTLNGQKMGKSLGNAISLFDVFAGNHELLEKPYSPMTIRFFILQSHYRGTLDFSNEALQASEKGLKRLMGSVKWILREVSGQRSAAGSQKNPGLDISSIRERCYAAMNDDFNSPILIAELFEAVRITNLIKEGKEEVSESELAGLKEILEVFVLEILGLLPEDTTGAQDKVIGGLMDSILSIRQEARQKKDFATSDKIRDDLARLNIRIKDGKDGVSWEVEEE